MGAFNRFKSANGVSQKKDVVAFVGYLASPNGLNGEAALVDWINAAAGAKTFDLLRDRERFQDSVEGQLETLESDPDRSSRLFNRRKSV